MSGSNEIASIKLVGSGISFPVIQKNSSANPFTIYGGCEQSGSPTPSNPIPITCNNGILKGNTDLPTGYTRLTYIQGDGNTYIDLGFPLESSDEVEFEFEFLQDTNSRQIFGYRDGASSKNVTAFFAGSNNNVVLDFNNSTYTTYRLLQAVNTNTKYKVIINSNSRAIYTGSTLVGENTVRCTDYFVTGNAYLFYCNGTPASTGKFNGRIYSFKIKGKCNLIPCININNEVGMYDIINDKFYTSDQNGAFTAGTPVKNLFDGDFANIELGYWLRNTDGQPEASSANFYYKEYIPVEPNTSYVFFGKSRVDDSLSGYNRISWYDSAKQWIRNSTYTQGTIGQDISPAGAAYARMSCNPNTPNAATQLLVESYNWMFYKGDSEIPFAYTIDADGTKEVIIDTANESYSVIDNLFGIDSTYRDEQVIRFSPTTKQVIRKTALIVLNGTENWQMNTIGLDKKAFSIQIYEFDLATASAISTITPYGCTSINYAQYDHGCFVDNHVLTFITIDNFSSVDSWKAYLETAYNKGEPVIAICQLDNSVQGKIVSTTFPLKYLPITIQSSLSNPQVNYTSTNETTTRSTYSYKNNITSVDLQNTPWVNNSMKGAFATCTNLTSVTNINSAVTDMDLAFTQCSNLTTTPNIPAGVTSLYQTFWDCRSLTTPPVIPNGVTNMHSTFYGCEGFTTPPTIPNSVTDLGATFEWCFNMTSAPTIPNGVTDLDSTFAMCQHMATTPIIPNSVTSMAWTFYGCKNIPTTPVIPSNVTNMAGCFYGCDQLTTPPTIPSGVTNMQSTFGICEKMQSWPTIPNGVTNLRECFYQYGIYPGGGLTDYPTLPNSVTDMCQTFAGTHQVGFVPGGYNITLPTSVTNLYECFIGNDSLWGNVYIPSTNVTDANNCFLNYNPRDNTLYVHVPANSTTYDSFVNAGYSTSTPKHQVLLVADL